MVHTGSYKGKASRKVPKKKRGTKAGHMMAEKQMRKMMKRRMHK